MSIEELSYVIESFYYSGRVKITTQSMHRLSFLQYARLGFAYVMRNLWLTFKKNTNTNNEYYFFSKQLVYQEFPLGEVNRWGVRRIDFGNITTIDLPENRDILYAYPKNGECGDIRVEEIVQITPGEAVFYKNNAEFDYISFMEKRGNGLDTYNVPPCVESVTVEAVWDMPELEIPNDIAFEVCKYVFQDIFKVKMLEVKSIDDFNSSLNEKTSVPETP
jgi:hypothetical protein